MLVVMVVSGDQDNLHGGPKQLIVEAGLASLPHSWDGARPPRSHSQETDLKEIKISVIIKIAQETFTGNRP